MSSVTALLKQQDRFNELLRVRRHELSAYHFSSIFLWQDHFEFSFEMMGDHLCVFAKHVFGTFLYLPPLGPALNPEIIQRVFKRLDQLNSKKEFSRIENVSQEDMGSFDPKRYKFTEKAKEYCYLRSDIVELKGNAYKSKRSSFNQFIHHYEHEFVPFGAHFEGDCARLFDAWAQDRFERSNDEIYRSMLKENRGVHGLIRKFYDELGLEGRVVLVNGKPKAYTFGYSLNEDTFCVLVETSNLQIKGLSVYVFSRFCADERLKTFPWINVMDDFAMDNVARTKESFHPKKYQASYVVTERT